jgi:hypothetical protein
MTSIYIIPKEILIVIVSYLDIDDLAKTSQLNKIFNTICNTIELWKYHYLKFFKKQLKTRDFYYYKDMVTRHFKYFWLFKTMFSNPRKNPGMLMYNILPLTCKMNSFERKTLMSDQMISIAKRISPIPIDETEDWSKYETWNIWLMTILGYLKFDIKNFRFIDAQGDSNIRIYKTRYIHRDETALSCFLTQLYNILLLKYKTNIDLHSDFDQFEINKPYVQQGTKRSLENNDQIHNVPIKSDPIIRNLVYSASLGEHINYDYICENTILEVVKLIDSIKFHLYDKITGERITYLLFKTGNCIISGAKSIESFQNSWETFNNELDRLKNNFDYV